MDSLAFKKQPRSYVHALAFFLPFVLAACFEQPPALDDGTSALGTQARTGLQVTPISQSIMVGASLSVSATGGSVPYTYTVASGVGAIDPSGTYTSTAVGSALVLVADAAGNQGSSAITVMPLLSLSVSNSTLSTSNSSTLTAIGGVPPYTYSVTSGGGSVSGAIYTASSSSGSAIVKVTDTAGNTATASLTINPSLAISVASTTLAVNNSYPFSASGGVAPYAYSIATGTGSVGSANGVYVAPASAGSASVKVTDSLGNQSTASVTVNSALAISPATTSVAVSNTKSFSAAGGVTPYTYSVASGGGSINSSSGLYTAPGSAGSAIVTVTDAIGNTSSSSVSIGSSLLSISPTSKTLAVTNTVTFSASGGTSPYTFSVFSGTGSVNSSTGVYTAPGLSGTAVVRVTDASSNTSDASVTINAALAISPSSVTLAVNNSFTFTASGGVAPYTYSVTAGTGSVNTITGVYLAPALSGTANVRVTDSLGNISNSSVTINAALTISPTTYSMAVNNTNTFTSAGGVSPFTFSILSGGGSINATTGVYTAPATAGAAIVKVIDNLGNSSLSNVTINGTLQISPTSKTLAVNNTTTFTASQGVSPYTYSVTAGTGSINSSSGVYTAPVSSGSATITVTDSLGNTTTASVTTNAALAISPTSYTLAVNNTKTFSASGGVTPYSYSVTAGTGSIGSVTGIFTAPALSGTATVRVTDSLGNTSDSSVTINAALAISPATYSLAVNNTNTFGAAGGVTPYAYSVASGGGTINATTGLYTAPATSGSAIVTVTDAIGNTSSSSVSIGSTLQISPSSKSLAVNNAVTFSATGGATPYTFSVFSGTGSVNSSTGVYTAPALSGTAVVRVTDNVGNTSDASVTINAALAISPTSKTLAVNNVFTFGASGGVGPYTYSKFAGTGSIGATTGIYTAPASSGTATILVTDSLGNTDSSAVTINAGLAISPTSYTLAINNTNTFSATGGVTPYTFSIAFGGGTINSSSGLYTAPGSTGSATVRVTDSLGNTSDSSVTINGALAISPPSFTLAVNNNKTFTASGGVTPYTFSVTAGTGTIVAATGVYTAPASTGTNTVRVTDAVGNTSDSTVTINAALAISPATYTLAVNNLKSFSASGGVAPYSFSLVSGTGTISAAGAYTAPSGTGTDVVRVTDAVANTSDSTVTINAALVISPPTKIVLVNGTFTFTASGGVTPYTFSVAAGTGSIVGATGVYTAPASPGTATVRVTDAIGNISNCAETTNPVLSISPTSKTIAVYNTATFTASGGIPPYTYSVNIGGAGGTINSSSGVYTAPSASGTDTVKVTDNDGTQATSSVSVIAPILIGNGGGSVGNEVCTVMSNGTVFCQGAGDVGRLGNGNSNASSTPVQAGNISTAVNVVTGNSHTCVTLNDNKVRCWGNGGNGALGDGTGLSSYVPVNVSGITTASTVKGALAAAYLSSCAVLTGNTIQCWGRNAFGQLGDGSTINKLSPVSVSGITTATEVAAGYEHYCALLSDGTVQCWGYNFYGQLGNNTTINSTTPVAVSGLSGVSKIANGSYHSCALITDGTVKCWGYNAYGGLGDGTTINRLTPVSVSGITTASSIHSSGQFTCAVLNSGATGTIQCWGRNGNYQLGDGTVTTRTTPVSVSGISNAVSMGGGNSANCALLFDNRVKCWGYNAFGMTGNGSWGLQPVPIAVSGVTSVSQAGIGNNHTCALSSAGTVKCWGYNGYGQLGNATTIDSYLPVNVSGLTSATSIVATANSSCALLGGSGTIKCWGRNTYGQIGDGTVTLRTTPVSVTGITTATAITGGQNQMCALLSDTTVRCWGYNGFGQIGNGDIINQTSPVAVSGLSSVVAIGGLGNHTCAALSNGTMKCWGQNNKGQLGDSTITNSLVPVTVDSLSNHAGAGAGKITGGLLHTCAVLSDGTAKCWGYGNYGQLGQGSGTDAHIPIQMLGVSGVTSVMAGGNFSCVLNSSGAVSCVGYNTYGGIGHLYTYLGSNLTMGTLTFPTTVSSLAVSSGGGDHACAVLSDGTIQCWGYSLYGQVGAGPYDTQAPTLVTWP